MKEENEEFAHKVEFKLIDESRLNIYYHGADDVARGELEIAICDIMGFMTVINKDKILWSRWSDNKIKIERSMVQ
jgi:hypothetical protein